MTKLLSLFLIILFSLSAQTVFADDEIFIQSDFIASDFSVLSVSDNTDLSDEQKETLRSLFIYAIENYETSVDISEAMIVYENGYTIHNSVVSFFASIANDTPEYFYVDLSKEFSFTVTGNVLSTMSISYTYDIETIKERTEAFKLEAQGILDEMSSKNITSDFDIALYLHDYIALNCEYDIQAASNPNSFVGHGIDAALLDKKAVCQGYANAYKYLLNQCGIECIDVYSDLGHHEWSMINIDGNWYHTDITFDDPTYDRLGYVSHELFLLTDEELLSYDGSHMKENSHANWYTTEGGYHATDTTYSNAPWRNTTTEIAFTDDYRYYAMYDPYDPAAGIRPKTRIVQCDKNMEIVNDNYYTINDMWYTMDSTSSYWAGFYSGLSEYNNCLYYNTGNKLMKIDTTLDTPQAEVIFNYESQTSDYLSDVYLFGSYICGNILYYAEVNYVTVDNQTIPLGTKNSKKMFFEIQEDEFGAQLDDSALLVDTESNIISGTVVADINLDNEEDSSVYFAVYENGVLKYIKKTTTDNSIFDVSLEYNKDNKYTYKLFVWNEAFAPYLPIISDTIE